MKILVGYTSKTGSTRGIATHIADRIRDANVAVDAQSMDAVQDISHYNALVLGSAIHGGDWLPEAIDFLAKNLEVLSTRPVWLFSVSTVGEASSAFCPLAAGWFRRVRRKPRQLSAVLPALHSRGHHDFAGAMKRGDWSRVGDLFLKLFGGHFGDFRNWREVDAWTDSIRTELETLTTARAI